MALWLGLSPSARAHVTYTDLSNPAVSPGGVNGGSFGNTGWFDGTTAALGDSHRLAGGTFFSFHLDQESFVDITFSDAFNSGLLNPAFSLYRGLLPDDAHDDVVYDPLNPSHLVLIPTPHVVKDPSPVDNGVTIDIFGRVSPFRDTVNINFAGQFDALHSWSMANESGDWAVIEYVAHADPLGGNSVSLLHQRLPAGDYTIAAGGGTDCAGDVNCFISNIDGIVSFSALAAMPDTDGDGIADSLDNCRLVANADQFDADNDGYGNRCDGDLNNNGVTNAQDYAIFRTRLGTADAAADLNHNGTVNAQDYAIFRTLLGATPGPSGLACAGTVPCPAP